jgi:hypothetical protein
MAAMLQRFSDGVMSKRPTWNDWLTPSSFRIRISLAAAEKLRALPLPRQLKIHEMLEEIAELAAAMSPQVSPWLPALNRPLLQLGAGNVTVRYALDEDTRTLSVEHVIVPEPESDDDHLDEVG